MPNDRAWRQIGGYRVSSVAQRKLQRVMSERWLLPPDRRFRAVSQLCRQWTCGRTDYPVLPARLAASHPLSWHERTVGCVGSALVPRLWVVLVVSMAAGGFGATPVGWPGPQGDVAR
jgi:hypothetical protein